MKSDPPVLHKLVYYIQSDGSRIPIRASELDDVDRLREVKGYGLDNKLTDALGETRFLARGRPDGENVPHFHVAPGWREPRRVYSFDTDPAHEARIGSLKHDLDNVPAGGWHLGYFDYTKTFVELARLHEYLWSTETHRVVSTRGTIRHDLYGQRWKTNAMSVLDPAVAIEVVNTHWPEPRALREMLVHSRRTPFIVLFETAPVTGRVLRVEGNRIVATFYLQGGRIMKEGREAYVYPKGKPSFRATTSDDLRAVVEALHERYDSLQAKREGRKSQQS